MVDQWSYNHRTGGASRHADNSDSDSENADTDGPCDVSSLLRDIDLSSRQETVNYKPNPWSIAKINARSRDSHRQSMKERSQLPSKSGAMPTMGPIGAAFKKQTDRAQDTQASIGGQRVLGENPTKVCSPSCGQTDKGNAKHGVGDSQPYLIQRVSNHLKHAGR
ncbi:hypothetical protein EDD15DRAFT_2207285 [Pisolithus albus]|nr:hypothetical protein EDD15DRAFT_2207285 [Pisolithus albus]